jgi:hypothetical protein
VVSGVSDGIGFGASEEAIHFPERIERVEWMPSFTDHFVKVAAVFVRRARRRPLHAVAHEPSFAACAQEVMLRVLTFRSEVHP